MTFVDPGYGDVNAPIGSEEWAKRWRLGFQNIAKALPQRPKSALEYLRIGEEYRAWTLLTDGDGKPFLEFDDFCRCAQPYGLGIDPGEFRRHLAAVLGDKAADLITAPVDGRVGNGDGRPRKEDGTFEDSSNSYHDDKNWTPPAKQARLRAILRAPEVVQALYREDRITQVDAARLGPRSPTPEQAGKVAEARAEIERIPESASKREARKQAKQIVARVLGRSAGSGLEALRRAWARASEEERRAFMEALDCQSC